jgi:hypothetical protein
MSFGSGRIRRSIPLVLGFATLAGVALLWADDAAPHWFRGVPRSHDVLAALSLALIAAALLVFRALQRPTTREMAEAILLAAAFLFWAANQFWPNRPEATIFNDIAIGLFVLDAFLAIASRREKLEILRGIDAGRRFTRDEMSER